MVESLLDFFCSLRGNIAFRYDGRLNYKDLNDNSLLNGVQTEALVGASDFFYQILPPSPQVRLWAPQLAFTNALGHFQVCLQPLHSSVK